MLQSKLNAPRVLRVNKVADYVRRKMEESGIALREEPLFWDPAKEERWSAEAAAAAAGAASGTAGAAPGSAGRDSLGGAVRPLRPIAAGGSGGLPPPTTAATMVPTAVLITCGGHTVPWDFSLAAVRQWMWKRSDDLVLHYSARDHRTPLRLPAIRPPS